MDEIIVQILGRDILISLIFISIIIFMHVKCKNEMGAYLYNIGIIIFSITMVIIFSLTGLSPMSGFYIDIEDIDDLILNTSGAMLGYLVLLAFKNLIPEVDKKINIELKFMKKEQILSICILVPYIVIIIGGFYDRYINIV